MNTQTRTGGTDAAALGLGSVLVGSLPAALMTDAAPHRYTVEAVFTRRPTQEELSELLDDQTHRFLANAGYPQVAVKVADRRLQITNTNLDELREGLAAALADRLAAIGVGLRSRRDAATLRFEQAAANERVRASAVAALAASVTFHPSPAAADRSGSTADQAQIDDWSGEGGRSR